MLKPVRISIFTALLVLAACAASGEAAPTEAPKPPAPATAPVPAPTPVPAPADPKPAEPKPLPLEIPTASQQDWERHLFDFQAADAEKQKTAMQAFVDSGMRGFNEMQKFVNSANADIAARAKQVQTEINKQSWERYTQCAALKTKVDNEPLTVPALQHLLKAWMAASTYSSQNALRQSGFQQASATQKQIQEVEGAQRNLTQHDESLKQTPETHKIARAGIQLDRANAFKILHRWDELIAACNTALEQGGPHWRLKPATLKMLVEAFESKQDSKSAGTYASRIIKEHPRSLEVKFAHENLLDTMVVDAQWPQAIEQLKAFYAACPIDSDVNDKILGTLSTMMDEHHEYKHVAVLAEWIIATLPRERLSPDAPKFAGGTSEYVLKDYSRAEKYYHMLGELFGDMVDPKDIDIVIVRVKQKAEGKFPKEPSETDAGPAGALARFLKAIRAKDRKAAAAAVIKEDAASYAEGDDLDNLIPGVTFADYIVKKVDIDEPAGRAVLTIDFYDASSATPQEITQDAVNEDGVWKMEWIEDGGGATIELQPGGAAPAPVQVMPAQPAPAK